ncbi:AsmA-like C-terminal region-containing protein [Methylotenera sp. G11]|uniref:AsmA-like C-terminal region-containing protein n=1 Tax=Methylotenera sp. G11 TaxID=1506585 RepID=UPI000690963C|nr:AsmA-like C-terminal region-containing protein [Methylotenera sp. G11]
MDLNTVFSKTAKASRAPLPWVGGLSPQFKQVLSLVDGKQNVEEILRSSGKLAKSELQKILLKLEDDGYIQRISSKAAEPEWLNEVGSYSINANNNYNIAVEEIDAAELNFEDAGFGVEGVAEIKPVVEKNAPSATEVPLEPEVERRAQEVKAIKAKREAERRLKAEAAEKARLMAAEQAKRIAEAGAKARQEVERIEREKAEAAAKLKAEAERIAREQAEAAEKARLEAERIAREEAEEQARIAAERKAAEEAAEKARQEAAEQARLEAERIAREEAEAIARAKAEEEARLQAEAERIAREEAEAAEKARLEAERIAREEAEERARIAAERKAAEEAAEKARQEAAEQARLEAERIAREEAEEQARLAAERKAEAEAIEKARLEAERIAREEAEERARLAAERKAAEEAAEKARQEAAEQARLEAERIAREEAEAIARAKAEEAARLQAEAERIAREQAEEQARIAAERKAEAEAAERKLREAERLAREEEKARREAEKIAQAVADKAAREEAKRLAREEKEAKAQRRAEEKARAREMRGPGMLAKFNIQSPKLIKPLLVFVPVAVIVLLGLIHVLNLTMLIEPVERLASASIGERVTVQEVHASLLPQPRLILTGVTVGDSADVRIGSVNIESDVSMLFKDAKVLKLLEISTVTLTPADFGRQMQWINNAAKSDQLKVEHIALKKILFKIADLELEAFNGKVALTPSGELNSVELVNANGNLTLLLSPQNAGSAVTVTASNWQLPLLTPLEFDELTASGQISQGQVSFSRIEAKAFGGTVKAQATLDWTGGLGTSGSFELIKTRLPRLFTAFGSKASVDGALNATATFAGKAAHAADLAGSTEVNASFEVPGGKLNGIALSHAVMAGAVDKPSPEAAFTRFDTLTGNLQFKDGQYRYKQLELKTGQLRARGQIEIDANHIVSGKVNAELMSASRRRQAGFTVSGEVADVKLQ